MRALACGVGFLLVVGGLAWGAPIPSDLLGWKVQYMVDQSQTVLEGTPLERDQWLHPRANRGLALSPDRQYLYAGYNYPNDHPEVRRIDLGEADYVDATVGRLPDHYGKAIATDDVGRVYLAEGPSIQVYSADLTTQLFVMTDAGYGFARCDGVAVAREGGTLALYGTDRDNQTLTRWTLTESGGGISAATQAGLDGDGRITVAGAADLRGVELDPFGRIWMADIDADLVFRVNGDGTGLVSAAVADAIDVGMDDGQVFVTQYLNRTITVLDADDLSFIRLLTPTWGALWLDPDGSPLHAYGAAALGGIAVIPGQTFYVANQGGQTIGERSTYGRDDEFSGFVGGQWYTALTHDDNDPILTVEIVPEPATLVLLALGALPLLRRRKEE